MNPSLHRGGGRTGWRWPALAIAIGAILLLVGLYELGYLAPEPELGSGVLPSNATWAGNGSRVLRAMIYDSLYREYPNYTLVKTLKSILESHGYVVDVYLGPNATLDQFPLMRYYDLIIIRAHGGYLNRTLDQYERGEYIYTGLYIGEASKLYGPKVYSWLKEGLLALGIVPPPNATKVEPESLPHYAVVTPKFIEEKASFKNGSIVILFSCNGLTSGELARIVLEKGAAAFVGWHGGVSVTYMDHTLPGLIRVYTEGGLEALKNYIESLPPDPATGARLEFITHNPNTS